MTSPAHEISSHPPSPASGGLGSLVKKFVSVERRAALKKFSGSVMIPIDWIYCAVTGFPYQTDWQLRGFPVLVCRSGGRLRIGKRWKAVSRLTANSMGVTQPVYLNISSGAALEIGDDVGMSGCSIACRQSISIGDRVLVGTGAVITDNDAHPIHPDFRTEDRLTATAPVKIESDVFIGARSFILKGVTIGQGAVVGAAAVVTKDVPPFAIVAGNPARVIGDSRRHHPTNPSTTPAS